jgi:hypothetical protein
VLDRPPSRPKPKPPPSRRAAWQRTYRRRQRDGVRLIEVTPAVIELLIAAQWLKPGEADGKHAISAALDAFAHASLKNFR